MTKTNDHQLFSLILNSTIDGIRSVQVREEIRHFYRISEAPVCNKQKYDRKCSIAIVPKYCTSRSQSAQYFSSVGKTNSSKTSSENFPFSDASVFATVSRTFATGSSLTSRIIATTRSHTVTIGISTPTV